MAEENDDGSVDETSGKGEEKSPTESSDEWETLPDSVKDLDNASIAANEDTSGESDSSSMDALSTDEEGTDNDPES